MILRSMLQRLYASLTSGPGLNARPHHSRQRLDLMELKHLQGTDPGGLLRSLLEHPTRPFEFPARVPVFEPPGEPENLWSDAQKAAGENWDRQTRLLQKIREIAADATDYYNDHGEHALFLGFPLLSLPPSLAADRQGLRPQRIVAPVALVPVNLRVRRGVGPGLALEAAADGADLVQPNPALLAWLEQQTGTSTDNLFNDESGEDPWREIREMLSLVSRAAGLGSGPGNDPDSNPGHGHAPPPAFDRDTALHPVPRTEQLPAGPAILPCAVLGLFPIANPGLLRDTKWMQENEVALQNPVRAFLAPEALNEPAEPTPGPEPEPRDATADPPARGTPHFDEELLVTQADPCQAAAVAHARHSAALVVHGPPGTGKSQTIANIIGDHLARGERVLFVCDKRTALDVVKYRLDSMGLGPLCGVIHDPQRDRSEFYLGLRERLENLAQDPVLPDPDRPLEFVNQRLHELHTELRSYFDQLHGRDGQRRSFHQLCGEWLSLPTTGPALPDVEGFTLDLLQPHRADAEEILNRAVQARWPDNPFRDRLGLSVSAWLASNPADISSALDEAVSAAEKLDRIDPGNLPSLEPGVPILEQAAARRRLADLLDTVSRRGLNDVAAALARDAQQSRWRRWPAELQALAADGARLGTPLERELVLQFNRQPPPLAACSRHLVALDQWSPIACRWTRFLAFAKRKTASAALEPLSLTLTPEHTERARAFYLGLKARHLWTDLRRRLLALAPATAAAAKPAPATPDDDPASDEDLLRLRDGLPDLFALLDAAEQPANATARPLVLDALAEPRQDAAPAIERLWLSADRADAIHELEGHLGRTRLFAPEALEALSLPWRKGAAAAAQARRFVEFHPTLDDAIRLTDRMRTLPGPLQQALREAAARGLPWTDAEPSLRSLALSREIRRRLREDDALARIDTRRVEAAFSEFQDRTAEKNDLVRQRILHAWHERWRSRLLAATGSRLNSLGASLRQRLFVRGQKAMKLRQMIASGSGCEAGDPLFDVCPVWMASPATVAQIFPRDVLFDVIVFDEASQCRLEEALPVLLRGWRVVIAGDPRQLPPTRFFEQALAESDATAPETAEEVFRQQQSEAEDLLTAALNLNVQEAFLDVHYRSRNEALIGFSNHSFYGGRLQPIPGHPRNKGRHAPVRLVRVDGVYRERGNDTEAAAAVDLVAELLAGSEPPSIGIACFNLNQRDRILDALDDRAAADAGFAERLEAARQRRGRDSFEGLFVKNLENVQGDERDHIIISTTFGPDPQGRFRRNFGALSRSGGERRLNVLVTRAREMIHVLTSIPRTEYNSPEPLAEGQRPTGRHHLYGYLRYAEQLDAAYKEWQSRIQTAPQGEPGRCEVAATSAPSPVAEAIARRLLAHHGVGSTVYWGNDGFCVDVALTHPDLPADVTVGVLADFTRYRKTPDPIAWEQFRTSMLESQGWKLHRLWSPALFRAPDQILGHLHRQHLDASAVAGSGLPLDAPPRR